MHRRFTDLCAVVTGGSTGIGLAVARGLIAQGARRVHLTGRSPASLEAAAHTLGEKAVIHVSDVSRHGDLDALAAEIGRRGDQIDMIFANAGIAENNILGETGAAAFDRIFDVNVKGVFFTVQALVPLMADGGAIVLTGSMVSNKGMERLSLYNASKAAVRSFARSFANDLKARRIRVNCLSPGFTRTPIMENGLKLDPTQIAQLADHARDAVPLGFMATPDDIAAAALFLASDEARYVDGIELTVDGGYTMV